MKLKIALLALVAVAGTTASFALADPGHHGRDGKKATRGQKCSRAVVVGTVAAPQSFTVTVTHAGRHSSFHTGDVVTVSVGSDGQTVSFAGAGCADGSTLTTNTAVLHARTPRTPRTTTSGTTTSETTTAETTTDAPTTSSNE
jgi:hypothetical protein